MLEITNLPRAHLPTLLVSLALAGCTAGDRDDLGGHGGLTGGEPEGGDAGDAGDDGGGGDDGGDDGDDGGDGGDGDTGEDDGTTSDGPDTDTGDSGDTTDDGNTSDTATEEELVPCDTASSTLEPIPPNIHLVLDKSGSMVQNTWDHDGVPATPEVTRWYSLHEVVESVTSSLEDQVNFGTVLFPSTNAEAVWGEEACIVENEPDVTVGPGNAAAILQAIPDKTAVSPEIAGGTPATAGLALAYADLETHAGEHPPAVIFVTDGAANCSEGLTGNDIFNVYDDDLLPLVSATWSTDGIPTYVVGIGIEDATTPEAIDGTPDLINPHEKLDELAVAGGKPNLAAPPTFYETNNQIELQAALQQAILDSMSCVVELDPLPPYPDKTKVFVGDVEVLEIADCATEDGWMYVAPSPPWDTIELCGSACDHLKSAGDLLVEYYCVPG